MEKRRSEQVFLNKVYTIDGEDMLNKCFTYGSDGSLGFKITKIEACYTDNQEETNTMMPMSPDDDDDYRKSEVTSYACALCGKQFRRPGTLREHMLCHTTGKPFQCEYCEKSYKNSKSLKQHMENHLELDPLLCPVCQKAYKNTNSLRTHLYNHRMKDMMFQEKNGWYNIIS
ncbi:hypothetical protein DMENIID0001_076040 [Sergentomyia squamirostris]